MIYWIVVLGGGAVAVTGYLLMFPFYASGIEGMQVAQVVHSIVAVLFVAAMLAHIYIGTIGMEGAFEAMGTGTVDVNWAREHHSLWLEQQKAREAANRRALRSRGAGGIGEGVTRHESLSSRGGHGGRDCGRLGRRPQQGAGAGLGGLRHAGRPALAAAHDARAPPGTPGAVFAFFR